MSLAIESLTLLVSTFLSGDPAPAEAKRTFTYKVDHYGNRFEVHGYRFRYEPERKVRGSFAVDIDRNAAGAHIPVKGWIQLTGATIDPDESRFVGFAKTSENKWEVSKDAATVNFQAHTSTVNGIHLRLRPTSAADPVVRMVIASSQVTLRLCYAVTIKGLVPQPFPEEETAKRKEKSLAKGKGFPKGGGPSGTPPTSPPNSPLPKQNSGTIDKRSRAG